MALLDRLLLAATGNPRYLPPEHKEALASEITEQVSQKVTQDLEAKNQAAGSALNRSLEKIFPGFKDGSNVAGDSDVMKLPTSYSAVSTIAATVAKVNLEVRERGEGYQENVTDHPFERLWNLSPCQAFSPAALRDWIIVTIFKYGNAYVYINRNAFGDPIGLHPVHPRYVTPRIGRGTRVFYEVNNTGNTQYSYAIRKAIEDEATSPRAAGMGIRGSRTLRQVQFDDMLHFHGVEFNGLMSPGVKDTGLALPMHLEKMLLR